MEPAEASQLLTKRCLCDERSVGSYLCELDAEGLDIFEIQSMSLRVPGRFDAAESGQ